MRDLSSLGPGLSIAQTQPVIYRDYSGKDTRPALRPSFRFIKPPQKPELTSPGSITNGGGLSGQRNRSRLGWRQKRANRIPEVVFSFLTRFTPELRS